LIFDNNFGKCGPILKVIRKKILYAQECYRIFTLNVTINMFN